MYQREENRRGKVSSLRMPAEHGAWGIITVPFFCAGYLAGRADTAEIIPLLLAAVSVLGIFLLRGSLECHGTWRALLLPVHVFLAALTGIAALVLLVGYARYLLIGLAALGGVLYLLQQWMTRAHDRDSEKRSLAAEVVGVAVLTLSAPAASIAAMGRLDRTALQAWLLSLLFFVGGVLYVKYRVRGVLAHRQFSALSERLTFAWPVYIYHMLLTLFLGSAVLLDAGSIPAMLLLAFAPAVLRAYGLLFQLGKRFPIKRLGWTEVAHSLVFAVLLILAIRQ